VRPAMIECRQEAVFSQSAVEDSTGPARLRARTSCIRRNGSAGVAFPCSSDMRQTTVVDVAATRFGDEPNILGTQYLRDSEVEPKDPNSDLLESSIRKPILSIRCQKGSSVEYIYAVVCRQASWEVTLSFCFQGGACACNFDSNFMDEQRDAKM
jgi:hypothetical protein